MPKKVKKNKPKKASRSVTYSTEEVHEPKLLEFTSTVKPYQVLEEDKELERLRVEQKQEAENETLLQKELEKPLGARNPTLMRKYASRVNETYSWPDISLKKYTITAYAPDSSEIEIEKRPFPYYANVDFTQNGTNFTYKFPISKFLDVDGESFYKIDGTNTVIDSIGNISDTYSDSVVTPYIILKKFTSGDVTESDEYKTERGDYYFDFPGFRVSSKVKADTVKTKLKTPMKLQQFKFSNNTTWVDGKTGAEMKTLKKEAIKQMLSQGIEMGDGVPIVPQNRCYIIEAVSSLSNVGWVVYTSESKLNGTGPLVLVGVYIEGLEYLKEDIMELDKTTPKSVFRSVASATEFVREWNKKKAEEFLKKK